MATESTEHTGIFRGLWVTGDCDDCRDAGGWVAQEPVTEERSDEAICNL